MARTKRKNGSPPSGLASLGVSGTYPGSLSMGFASAAGISIQEDFEREALVGSNWEAQQHTLVSRTASGSPEAFRFNSAISNGAFIDFDGTDTFTFTASGRYLVRFSAYGTDNIDQVYPEIDGVTKEPNIVISGGSPANITWTREFNVLAGDTLEIVYEVGGPATVADDGFISIQRIGGRWEQQGDLELDFATEAYTHEHGVLQMDSLNTGSTDAIYMPTPIYSFPKGMEMMTKLTGRNLATSSKRWFGFITDVSDAPDTASAVFVGWRAVAGLNSGKWSCMVMNAGSEFRFDTDISLSTDRDSAHVLGVKRELSGNFTFFRGDLTSPVKPGFEVIATTDDTYLTNNRYYPVIGCRKSVTSNRGLYVDFFNVGGRIARQ